MPSTRTPLRVVTVTVALLAALGGSAAAHADTSAPVAIKCLKCNTLPA